MPRVNEGMANEIREAFDQLNRKSLVDQAKQRIEKNRTKYAPPTDTFPAIAARWSQVLGCAVHAIDVAMCMAELKTVRCIFNPTDLDSRVDQYGYLIIRDELIRAQGDLYDI